MADLKKLLKGKKIIIYGRVSTSKQKKTLPTQMEAMRKQLKELGVKQSQIIGEFSEVGSGTLERAGLDEVLALAEKTKGKVAVVFRDVQRFARNGFHLGWMIYPFMRKGITFVDLLAGRATSDMDEKRSDDDLMTIIISAIGGKEVDTTEQRSKSSREIATAEGIISDRMDLMPKWELNPMRFMHEMITKHDMKATALTRMMPVKSKSSLQKRIRIINRTIPNVNKKELEEWFQTMDFIRELEAAHGPRYGGKQTRRMNAVGRMTSGYLAYPDRYPRPTREEIQFYYDNYNQFQGRK